MFPGGIKNIAWTPDSTKLVVVGDGKSIFARVFIWETGSQVGEISGISKILQSCDFRPQKPADLAVAGEEFNVAFYAGPPYKLINIHKLHTSFVNCVKYDPTGSFLLSASSDKSLGIYQKEKNNEPSIFNKNAHNGGITHIEFFQTEDKQQYFVTSSLDKTCKIWNINEKDKEILNL